MFEFALLVIVSLGVLFFCGLDETVVAVRVTRLVWLSWLFEYGCLFYGLLNCGVV